MKVCQFAIREKRERECAAGIGESLLQTRSIGTVSVISASIHIERLIFLKTLI